jgi:hypothetical protein
MMNLNDFTHALKLIAEEYRLNERQVSKMSRRLMADEAEFKRVWHFYIKRDKTIPGGVDAFKDVLNELLS